MQLTCDRVGTLSSGSSVEDVPLPFSDGKDEDAPARLVPWINNNKSYWVRLRGSNRATKRHTVEERSFIESTWGMTTVTPHR